MNLKLTRPINVLSQEKQKNRQGFFFVIRRAFGFKIELFFSLTGKTQLSDLWNIDFDASSLATADHFAAWEKSTKKLQPALDYKPVDMKIDKTKIPAGKKKRGDQWTLLFFVT